MTAALTKQDEVEISGIPNLQVLRLQLTGGTSAAYTTKFKTIRSVVVSNETTNNTVKASWSGAAVTVTATADDYVNLWVWGDL